MSSPRPSERVSGVWAGIIGGRSDQLDTPEPRWLASALDTCPERLAGKLRLSIGEVSVQTPGGPARLNLAAQSVKDQP